MLFLGTIFITFLLCLTHQPISAAVPASDVNFDVHYRLPTSLKPENYQLKIITYLESSNNLSFVGDVLIKLNVLQETNNITLHAQNLTIDNNLIRLKTFGSVDNIPIQKTLLIPKHDFLVIFVEKSLKPGQVYELFIPFSNFLNDRLRGYYKSSYLDKQLNEKRWLSVTQFEPASARAAFPCFDEPAFKATFLITLGHHENYTALSNMPLKSQINFENQSEWIWSTFEESVSMSTYLVAYTINDFSYLNSTFHDTTQVQFRTWSRRDAIDQCHFASVIGPQVLEYYENIFNIKFPLRKVDQIAIPDFSAGAMENWGLVTYRETTLLYADKVSSLASKQRVASVIAHELAHQWFGNLVTMKWWTDIWLNEGFATYIASLGVENINPSWKLSLRESVDNMLAVFKLDALESSHPVSQPINHVSQIHEIFDTISYKKGSAVLRMMHLFLGDEAFFTGVSNYLMKHAYDNAEQDDLWQALTQTAYKYNTLPANINIKQVMDSWTLQSGYPIINVKRDYSTASAVVNQSYYLINPNANRAQKSACWWVPLTFTQQNMANFTKLTPSNWLECNGKGDSLSLKLVDLPSPDEWILFNIQMAGLYRVNYDNHNWNLLINALLAKDFNNIHILNRAQLIDDTLNLAWSGDQEYDVALQLLEYLVNEKEYIPWKTALDNLNHVNRLLLRTTDYMPFKMFMRRILVPIYNHLEGLNDTNLDYENPTSILHKSLVSSWACHFDIEDCVARAKTYFVKWRSAADPHLENPVPTDLRSTVYCTAIRSGDQADWNFLWDRYKTENVASEKRIILSALGCSKNVNTLSAYVKNAFDITSAIRKQDSTIVFAAVAHSETGFSIALDYLLSNISSLEKYFEPDTSELSRLFTALSSQISDDAQYETMVKFVEQHWDILSKGEQSIRRFLETIHVNTLWKRRHYTRIVERLSSKNL